MALAAPLPVGALVANEYFNKSTFEERTPMSDKVWYLGKGKKKVGPWSRSRVKQRMAND